MPVSIRPRNLTDDSRVGYDDLVARSGANPRTGPEGDTVFVAEDVVDGSLVGMVSYIRTGNQIEGRDFATRPTLSSVSVGADIIDEANAHARAAGATRAWCYIRDPLDEPLDPTMRLYLQARGYAVESRLDRGWIKMFKNLPAAVVLGP